MAFFSAKQQQQTHTGPIRGHRSRRKQRSNIDNGISNRRPNRSEGCSAMALDLSVETIDVDVRENEADVSCIDITEDDDVVCIGSERSEEVLRLRTVNRRLQPALQPLCNTHQSSRLIGSGETVNSLGPTLNALPLPPVVAPVEKIVGKVIKCSVCLEDVDTIVSKGDRKVISTNCGHIFCETCIKEAIRTAKSCPTCRKKLNQKSYHQIFL